MKGLSCWILARKIYFKSDLKINRFKLEKVFYLRAFFVLGILVRTDLGSGILTLSALAQWGQNDQLLRDLDKQH
jgi:hypothetical protein